MTWYDRFKTITEINGSTETEISNSLLQDSFDTYYAMTPDRITGKIDGVVKDFVIQHLRYGEDESDIKLLLTENATPISTGSIIDFDSKKWLAINEENRAITTHQAFKIQLCNNTINWKDIDDNTYSEYCVYTSINSRLDTNKKLPKVDNTILIGVQNNDDTSNIQLNDRFIFSHKWAYKISMIDDMDIQYENAHNIIWITLEEDMINDDADDLLNNIADRYIQDIQPTPPTDGISFTIDEMNVKVGLTSIANVYEYIGGVQQSTTFTFRIDGIDSSLYDLTMIDGNTVMVKGLDYQYAGSLVAIKDVALTEESITINLNGIF